LAVIVRTPTADYDPAIKIGKGKDVATKAQRRQATQNRIKAMSHVLRAEAFRLIRDKGLLSPKEAAMVLEADLREVSYHIRKLREFNCVEEVESRRVRGGFVAHFYRATAQHMIDTDEWAELVELEPEMAEFLVDEFMQAIVDDFTKIMRGVVADFTGSRRADIVGLDEEFYLTRTPLLFDPEGIREALQASENYESDMLEIADRSLNRHATQGTEEIPVSSSIAFFKMPKPAQR
jgi:DNA-binding transcriptional ArsR family regulator